MSILLTGISGFIGSAIMEDLLLHTQSHIVGVASWRHKGLPTRVSSSPVWQKHKDRVTILTHDLNAPFTPDLIDQMGNVSAILNIASDSHVDRSITHPVQFVENNVQVALNVLELARHVKPRVFLQFSTDEVYGQCPKGKKHVEWSPIIPSNPYSASKACQEAIAVSYWRTYGVPVIVTNTMNVFGPGQDWEKFIPMVVKKVLRGEEVQIHAYPGCKEAGSRFYIHVNNVASAVRHIVIGPTPEAYPEYDRPERYNIVGEAEVDNLSLAKFVAIVLKKELRYKLVDFHSSRPGHDCRYALDGSALAKIGWVPPLNFNESLKETVLQLKAKYEGTV